MFPTTLATPRALDTRSLHALRRSHARRLILAALVRDSPSYPTLLAREAGLDLPSALGALRGLGRKYAPGRSLVGLGLVEEVPSPPGMGNVRMYAPTERGLATWAHYEALAAHAP